MKIFAFFLFLAISFSTFGQLNQTVRGRVTDKITSQPIPGVNVYLKDEESKKGTTTDMNGNFILKNINVGRNTFVFSFIGYEKVVLNNIMVTSGKELILNVEMTEQVVEVEQVTVKAYKKGDIINKMATVSARTFSTEEAERYAGSWLDPARMATNFAGVLSTANDSRNDIVIRGNSPNGLLWRLEGVDIPNPNHFAAQGSSGGPISMLNSNQLARSDFFTGAFPAQYGNALSGVFDINLRNGNDMKHEFLAQMAVNGFEIGAEGPLSSKYEGSYIINARYSFLDFVKKLKLISLLETIVPVYSDLSFKFYVPTKIGNFSLIGLGGVDELKTDKDEFYNQGNPWFKTKLENNQYMGVLALVHKLNLNEKSTLKTSVAYSTAQTKNILYSMKQNELNKLLYWSEINEPQLSLSTVYTIKSNAKNNISAGFMIKEKNMTQIDSVNIGFRFVKQTELINKRIQLIQEFAEWKHRFSNSFDMYFGFHSQGLNFNYTKTFEPRLGVNWNFAKNQSFKFGYGIHAQMQNFQVYFAETTSPNGNTHWKTCENLDFTKAQHFVLGYNYNITENLNLRLESYYQDIWDVPVDPKPSNFSTLNLGAQYYNGAFDHDSLVNEGLGKNYGVDFTLEKYLNRNWYMLLTSSVFDSKYKPSDQIWRHTVFAANYSGNALFGVEFPVRKNSSIDFNFRVVWSGGIRPLYVDKQASVENGVVIYDDLKAYSERTKDYFKLDLKLTFRRNSKKSTQEWAFDISNATDHKNVFTESFNPGTGKTSYTYQLGLMPTGMFRVTF